MDRKLTKNKSNERQIIENCYKRLAYLESKILSLQDEIERYKYALAKMADIEESEVEQLVKNIQCTF